RHGPALPNQGVDARVHTCGSRSLPACLPCRREQRARSPFHHLFPGSKGCSPSSVCLSKRGNMSVPPVYVFTACVHRCQARKAESSIQYFFPSDTFLVSTLRIW